jgi:hypothetical protein
MGTIGPVEAAELVADEIRDTTISLSEVLETLELPAEYVDNATFCATLDQLVFECVGCGWWCGTDETGQDSDGGELRCDECAPIEDDRNAD